MKQINEARRNEASSPATVKLKYPARVNYRWYVAYTTTEASDMSNPEGHVYRPYWFVEVQPVGENEVFKHFAAFDTEEEAIVLRDRIGDAGAISLDRLNADGNDCWTADRIPYGNPGWTEQEIENEIMDARDAGERHPMDVS